MSCRLFVLAVALCMHALEGFASLPVAVRIDGVADGDLFGISAGGLGDCNGDGIDDVVVAAEEAQHGRGSAYVIYGRAGGVPRGLSPDALDGRNGFRIDGDMGEGFNSRARSAGDINADGFGDLAVAHPSAAAGAGRVCIVFGRRAMPAQRSIIAFESGAAACFHGAAQANAGREVAALGDVDGDGIGDLAIGAPLADHAGIDSGSVYVVYGRTDGFAPDVDLDRLDGRDGFRIDGAGAGDGFGLVVAAAGDVDADGLRDLLIGAELAHGSVARSGAAYVVLGRTARAAVVDAAVLGGRDGFRIRGDVAHGRFGRKVAGGGDVDGDGVDDLAVGAPFAADGGAVAVVYGRHDGGFAASIDAAALDGHTGFVVDGFAAGSAAGDGVALIGDIDGDGRDELAIGAQRTDANAGSVRIVRGRERAAARVTADGSLRFGSGAGAHCGHEIRALGDIDADGSNDVLVSCHVAAAGGRWRGSVHIVDRRAFEAMYADGFE